MNELLVRDGVAALDAPLAAERPARDQLRAQIARLDRTLSGLVGEGFGRIAVEHGVSAPVGSQRVLDLGELERTRDALVARIAGARTELRERAHAEAAQRELLGAMLADPAAFKWVRVTREELGEPGCGEWHSKPRLGPIGMLMGWWRVKVSSGCPRPGRLAAVE
jgi:hypothetical protein